MASNRHDLIDERLPRMWNPKTTKMEFAFFKDRDPNFLHMLSQFMDKQSFQAGDVIMREGEIGYDMYFIHSGSASVCVGPDDREVETLKRGGYFGEMALFGCARRMATIKACERTSCLVMKRRAFSAVLNKFPEEQKYFQEMASRRRLELTKINMQTCYVKHKRADSDSEKSITEDSPRWGPEEKKVVVPPKKELPLPRVAFLASGQRPATSHISSGRWQAGAVGREVRPMSARSAEVGRGPPPRALRPASSYSRYTKRQQDLVPTLSSRLEGG
eukprot:TRINITY_DN26519_c0_g1_i1.p1 TRINITY_DN26519_c0_g1~~TRINITY_DN26519_c0_g1_i1.p1  ORF type:complete len:281 (-),score=44.54 TRINITY_DN26519_c0_g1_i1:34-855(-)